MKIVEVESFVLHAPIPRRVTDAFNQADKWGLPGVRIRTDEGLEGTGYTSTLTHGDFAIKDILDRIYAPLLLGEDPLDTQRHWDRLYWSDAHWVGRLGITHMALAAVDIALWDLKAKHCGLPLWRLAGGHKQGQVRSYNTDGGWLNFEVPRLIDEMSRIVDQGWSGVKMKIGKDDPREDLRRVAAVRDALGPDIDLMIDVNQRWNRTRAVAWAERFAEFDIGWLEEPIDPDDVEGHARIADATSIPIAVGEHVYTRTAFRDLIVRGNIGVVQVDATRVGGITEWLAVAELANSYHVPVIPHHADMMRVHQHLGVAHPGSPMIECIPWLQELFHEPADIRAGVFHVSETPGASTTFTDDAFAQYRVA
ncbi:mandelate racemase/muconate lactonizing enzyme family protein [Kribbella jiaozuonensis]|uniref:Mandelate racemase/muconate lactonizing enzyme family protein n=1 Tax=Kribbella jiaozuonensis TaxID=2575441 RepID=A0A4V5UXZ2_9ACTN|nr:mandelate racemase/muconate lactonizing enzyme family protein [Kribbella jiaozuonensis]TKK82773.1 mandelate racemase/muconate lactonizing enzyme family protein [Kribbella jiaozuonensis]